MQDLKEKKKKRLGVKKKAKIKEGKRKYIVGIARGERSLEVRERKKERKTAKRRD